MTEFLNELKNLNKQAEEGIIAKQREEELLKQEEHAKRVAHGERIIRMLPDLCRKAAKENEKKAQIMILNRYYFHGDQDVDSNAPQEGVEYKHLGVAAQMVYRAIEELGMKPIITWDHDGVGIKDWNVLWASWEDQ